MNFLYDRIFTESQRRRIEAAETKALQKQKKLYADMMNAARKNADDHGRTGQTEIEGLRDAAEESEQYKKLARKFEKLEAEQTEARFELYADLMAEYLRTVGTDPAEILADLAAQTDIFINDLDARQDAERDPAGKLPESYCFEKIAADLLPYYVEALAASGAENAATQCRNCVYTQLHNNAIVSRLPDGSALPADPGTDPAPVLKPFPKLKTVLLMRDKIITEIVKASGPEYLGLTEEENGQLKMSWLVSQDNRNDAIFTFVALRLDPAAGVPALSAFEMAIIESVATRYRQHKKSPAGRTGGACYISPAQILADITGRPDLDPHQTKLDEIRRAVDKLSTEIITLDFSAEHNAGRIAPDTVKSATSRAPILQTSYRKVTLANGSRVEVYKIADEPEIFTYCRAKGRLTGISAALLDVSDAFRRSDARAGRLACDPDVIAIKFYLLKTIYAMYEGRRKMDIMLYDTIAKESGTDPEKKYDRSNYKSDKEYKTVIARQDKRNRERVAAILDAWTKGPNGKPFIKAFDYHPNDARKPRGIKIILFSENPYKADAKAIEGGANLS